MPNEQSEEAQWIIQDNIDNPKIFIEQQEWQLAQLYIAEMQKKDPDFTSKPRKITRKELKEFIEANSMHPEISRMGISTDDINHSFFIFADKDDPKKYGIGALARSKEYEYKGIKVREGILGSGTLGRVNPCLFKKSDECTPENPGKFLSIKALVGSDSNSVEHEVNLLRKMDPVADLILRDRSLEFWYTAEDADTKWILDEPIGAIKAYIVQEIAPGVPLHKVFEHDLDTVQQIQIALAFAKAVQQMHDAKIIHSDLNLANCMFLTDLETKYVATLIDFGRSLDMSQVPPERARVGMQNDINKTIDILAQLDVKGIGYGHTILESMDLDLCLDKHDAIKDIVTHLEQRLAKEIKLNDDLNCKVPQADGLDFKLDFKIRLLPQTIFGTGYIDINDHRDVQFSFNSPVALSKDKIEFLARNINGSYVKEEPNTDGVTYTFHTKALWLRSGSQSRETFINNLLEKIKLQRRENAAGASLGLGSERP